MQRFVFPGALPVLWCFGPSQLSACERVLGLASQRIPVWCPVLALLFLRGLCPTRRHLFVSDSLMYLFLMALER